MFCGEELIGIVKNSGGADSTRNGTTKVAQAIHSESEWNISSWVIRALTEKW